MCDNCSCGTNATQDTEPIKLDTAPIETVYGVEGMTCGHCASSVSDQLAKLDGVVSVDVEVSSGSVTVRSTSPLDRETVRGAVDEAGYQLAGA
ncbi:heavy-metal-associated domain-containing protein [Kribbella shirazensis]|uniref:Copper chaperone CopZ n=1 Tax=Kribbella shirazensis TaxID=1105143 RepID=A0A7X5VC79_9ACTN|nr:heavy-metal-associated domain-containing protein [Kribbella shirazensis]NIK58554.1 copper chaperone CopZ [Kribbella shirazensis]